MLLPLLKALSDSTRLRLVFILSRGEFTVQELMEILTMGQSRVSRHLKLLLDVDLLRVQRQGTWGYYRLVKENPFFEEIWPALERSMLGDATYQADLESMAQIFDRRRRRSQDFFNRNAQQWDGISERLFPLVDYLPDLKELISSCDTFLEVGVGTGNLLPILRPFADRIIGIDQSPAMLQQARLKVTELALTHIELRLGEMSHLPVSQGEADSVLLNMVLHHAPHPVEVLREIHRILAPKGTLIIADLLPHAQEWARDSLADLWLGFQRDELEQWVREAGMTIVTYRPVEGNSEKHGVFLLKAEKI